MLRSLVGCGIGVLGCALAVMWFIGLAGCGSKSVAAYPNVHLTDAAASAPEGVPLTLHILWPAGSAQSQDIAEKYAWPLAERKSPPAWGKYTGVGVTTITPDTGVSSSHATVNIEMRSWSEVDQNSVFRYCRSVEVPDEAIFIVFLPEEEFFLDIVPYDDLMQRFGFTPPR